jgi:protein-disulfide isomerase
MNTTNENGGHKGCLVSLPCETKVAYLAILLLFGMDTLLCYKIKEYQKGGKALDEKVTQWVNENPEMILNSLNKHMEKKQNEQQKRYEEGLSARAKENMEAILDDKNMGVYNPNGKKKIVVFFDYNCGYCKMASKAIGEVIKTNEDVKVIFKELPIRGAESLQAAKYSIAVAMTDSKKFHDFHNALMGENMADEDGIKRALNKVGIKRDRIVRTLKVRAREIDEAINKNRNLADKIGLSGTPVLVIEGKITLGFVDADAIRNML